MPVLFSVVTQNMPNRDCKFLIFLKCYFNVSVFSAAVLVMAENMPDKDGSVGTFHIILFHVDVHKIRRMEIGVKNRSRPIPSPSGDFRTVNPFDTESFSTKVQAFQRGSESIVSSLNSVPFGWDRLSSFVAADADLTKTCHWNTIDLTFFRLVVCVFSYLLVC